MKKIISAIVALCTVTAVTGCGDFIVEIPPEATTVTAAVETEVTIVTAEETTAPVTSVPERETLSVKLSFAGDVLLASFMDETKAYNFNDFAGRNPPSYFLEKVRPVFEDDDFTIVNLENVFTDRDLPIIEKDHDPAYWYKSKTSNVEILTCASVEGVSLSNNHTGDYGDEGYADTVRTVTDAGLYYGDTNKIMYLEKDGFTVAVICTGLWSQYQTQYAGYYLETAKENSDFQVVFFHGGTELVHEPEEWKREACRQLVDMGADLVVGSHPHILQPMETYNGVDIVYSMGNFCFGDWFRPENRTIIYRTELTVDKETMTVTDNASEVIPCYVYTGDRNNYQPVVIENKDEIDRVMAFMRWECDSPV